MDVRENLASFIFFQKFGKIFIIFFSYCKKISVSFDNIRLKRGVNMKSTNIIELYIDIVEEKKDYY